MSCFNAQQQFAFPFLVYCAHSETLALLRGPEEHVTFDCAPNQLQGVLQKLKNTEGARLAPKAARSKRR